MERFRRDGSNRLLLDRLGLTPDSVVLDVGGYQGDYTASLLQRYGCRVHVFEPIPVFADVIDDRFRGDSRVMLHRAAIGAAAGTMEFDLRNDATSAVDVRDGAPPATSAVVTADVVAVTDLGALGVDRVDLLAMNIEGGEYELIQLLAESGHLERVNRLFVQFHEVSSTSRVDRERCRALLARSHLNDWDYPFVWESWTQVGGGSVT